MIGLIGINYKSSPLEIREKFSFTEQQIIDFFSELRKNSSFSGLVVLTTCNRSEVYFRMKDCCDTAAYSFIMRSLKAFFCIEQNIRDYFYLKSGEEAYKHLFHVVSGANSMVLGEDQIVRQVKEALRISTDNKLSDTELTRLFTKSFEANKKIRTQTKINQGAFSVSYAAVEKCMVVFPDIVQQHILLVGAGETGELTLKSLLKKGCKNIVIANRTHKKAIDLANQYNVNAIPFEELEKQLVYSDIIIVSTGSQKPLITGDIVEDVIKSRQEKKQLYIDLSVPRNVSPDVSEIENTVVYDVDALQEVVVANQEKRKALIREIDQIISGYIDEYSDWLSVRNLSSVISTIKSNFLSVNEAELVGFKNVNKSNESELVEHYGTHITEKYTRLLIKNLKEVTDNGRNMEYVSVFNSLFELN